MYDLPLSSVISSPSAPGQVASGVLGEVEEGYGVSDRLELSVLMDVVDAVLASLVMSVCCTELVAEPEPNTRTAAFVEPS